MMNTLDELLLQKRVEEAYAFIKDRTDTTKDFLYKKSLLCRIFDDYDRENQVVEYAISLPFLDKQYFEQRFAWHELSPFEQREPRPTYNFERTMPVEQRILDNLCFVTGAHDGYFELLIELIESIKATTVYKDIPLFVLDHGLQEHQKNYLANTFKIRIKTPDGSLDHPYDSKSEIDKYFPGYQFYFWLDADMWVQDESKLDGFINLSAAQGIGCAQEWHTVVWERVKRAHKFRFIQHRYVKNSWFYPYCFLCQDIDNVYLSKAPYFNSGAIVATKEMLGLWSSKIMELTEADRYPRWCGDQPALQAVYCDKRLKDVLDPTHMAEVFICQVKDGNAIQVDDNGLLWFNSMGLKDYIGIVHFAGFSKNGPGCTPAAQLGHGKALEGCYKLFQLTLPKLDSLESTTTSLRYRVLPWSDKPKIREELSTP